MNERHKIYGLGILTGIAIMTTLMHLIEIIKG